MSWWTEVFLAATSLENDAGEDKPEHYLAIDRINEYLSSNRIGELFLVVNPNVQRHTPCACFMAHCKNLDRDEFAEIVRQAPWKWKEQVQLFFRQEDDKGFREEILWY